MTKLLFCETGGSQMCRVGLNKIEMQILLEFDRLPKVSVKQNEKR